jgi:hypothetical protein
MLGNEDVDEPLTLAFALTLNNILHSLKSLWIRPFWGYYKNCFPYKKYQELASLELVVSV